MAEPEVEQDDVADKAEAIGKELGVEETKGAEDVPDYEIEESADDASVAKEREPRVAKKEKLSNREKRHARMKRLTQKLDGKDAEIDRLRQENEQIKKWKNEVDGRLSGINEAELQKDWNQTNALLEKAKKDYADSFAEGDGNKNVAALALMSDAKDRLAKINDTYNQFVAASQRAPQQQTQAPDSTIVNKAKAWAKKNDWYNPSGTDVDSEIAKAISGVLANEGYDPKTDDFWDELDERLAERLPDKYQDEEDDAEDDEPEVKKPVISKKRSSPPVAGSVSRGDGANKVKVQLPTAFIKLLQDNGMWDDKGRRDAKIAEYLKLQKQNKSA